MSGVAHGSLDNLSANSRCCVVKINTNLGIPIASVNFGPSPKGIMFFSCWAAHAALGFLVTPTESTSRVPALMMKKAKIGLNQRS